MAHSYGLHLLCLKDCQRLQQLLVATVIEQQCTCTQMYMCVYMSQLVFSLAYSGGMLAFTAGFTLMWNWGGANGFDVDTGSTHYTHSQCADWGEHS